MWRNINNHYAQTLKHTSDSCCVCVCVYLSQPLEIKWKKKTKHCGKNKRTQHVTPPTKEAIDDAEEAAHGAHHRRNNFIVPLNLLITARVTVSSLTLTRWGELKGQQLGRGGHDGHVGDLIVGTVVDGRVRWIRKDQ